MEAQNMSFLPEIPPHGNSDDAAAQFTTPHSSKDAVPLLTNQPVLSSKGKHKICISQGLDYAPDGKQEKPNRMKTGTTVKQASSAKLGGGRVFTDNDEINILQGLLGYCRTNNVSDLSSINWSKAYIYLTTEGKLSSSLTVNQIYEKVRGLKKKYLKNLEKEKSGEGLVFTSHHDILVFKISKNVWGGTGSEIVPSDGIGVDDEVMMIEEEKEEDQHSYDIDGEDPGFSKSPEHGYDTDGSEEAMELKMTWMKLRLNEIKHEIMKLKMESELIKIAMNEMKKL